MKTNSHLITAGATMATVVAFTSVDTGISTEGLSFISNLLKLDIVGMTLLGSILPDIDSNHSVISKMLTLFNMEYSTFKRRLLAFFLIAFTFSRLKYPLLFITGLFILRKYYYGKNLLRHDSQHRALPHSIWGVIGFSIIIYRIQQVTGLTLLVPFVISYSLHLFFDCFTMKGIPLLGTNKHFRLPSVLCFTNDHSKGDFLVNKKELIIAYSYTFLLILPVLPRIIRFINRI